VNNKNTVSGTSVKFLKFRIEKSGDGLLRCKSSVKSRDCVRVFRMEFFYLGVTWRALDSRVGSVIGRYNGDLYAVGRNQIAVIKYNTDEDDWYLLTERQKNNLKSFFDQANKFKDFTTVTSEEDDIRDIFQDWGATDDYLYYRPTQNSGWERKARWRL
jgi:hypothetical protein